MVSEWPHYKEEDNMAQDEAMMELAMDGIRNIRNARAEMDVPPSKKAKVIIIPTEEKLPAIEAGKDYFVTLASASEVQIQMTEENVPEDAVSVVIEGAKIFIPLDELVDFSKELDRLNKEYREKGVSIKGMLLESGIGLTDEEKATAKEILSKANATYQQLTVTKDMVEKDDTLLLQAFPTTFFIDKDGNIVDSIEGSNDYDGWKAKIDEVLKKVEANE